MRKAKSLLVEVSVPPLDAVLEPTERTTERQWFTFTISRSFINVDLYHIEITDWDMILKADVVWRDNLIEFISAFDE